MGWGGRGTNTRGYYECRVCGKLFKAGGKIVELDIEQHVKKDHKELNDEIETQKNCFNDEFDKRTKEIKRELLGKYPLAEKRWQGYCHKLEKWQYDSLRAKKEEGE